MQQDFSEWGSSALLGGCQLVCDCCPPFCNGSCAFPRMELQMGREEDEGDTTTDTFPDLDKLERMYGGDGRVLELPLRRGDKHNVGRYVTRTRAHPTEKFCI